MAFNQTPLYGAPQQQYYGQPEPSYDSTYSRGHAQPAGNQGYGFNNGCGGSSTPHYADQYTEQEGYNYDQRAWSHAPAQYQRNDGFYAGRGQQTHREGRPNQHRHPRAADRAGVGSSEPRGRGTPSTTTGSAMNGHQGHQDHHHQPNQHRRLPDQRRQYDRYQNVVPPQAKGGHGYGEVLDEPQDDRQAQQGYDRGYAQPPANYSHGKHQDYQRSPAEYDSGHQEERHHKTRQTAPNPRYDQAEVPNPRPQKAASQVEEPKQTKQTPKKVLDDIKLPDTVAWDNPFPTFPAAKFKPTIHSDTKEHSQTRSGDSRPHTANGKNGHGSARHEEARENGVGDGREQDDFIDPSTGIENGRNYDEFVQERPSISQTGRSAPQGCHSEEARIRPIVANEVNRGLGYERSHTMPTAVTNAIVNPHDEMPEVSAWQEPGATAGYYGGEDKGFVASPLTGTPQQRLQAQSMAHSDEGQRQPTSRFPPRPIQQQTPVPQSHAHQDSLGEVLDSYYDGPQVEARPYVKEDPYQRRPALLDEMPNFAATRTSSASHEGEMTISQHLQPQSSRRPEELPPLPPQGSHFSQRQHPTNDYGLEPFPRSRSQPDFNGQRSPSYRPPQNHSFEFGVPGPADQRPATSSSIGRPGPRSQYPLEPLLEAHHQDPRAWTQQHPGLMLGAGQRSEDRPGGNGYGDPRRQEGNRSPPQRNGPYRSPQQDIYQPAPQQNGPYQGPAQQDRYRSPVAQNGRLSEERVRRSGGGQGVPSPNSRSSPTSPAPPQPLSNPDALPHHPAPIRPGLMESSPVNPANKPPPVRQYNNNPSSMNLADPTNSPGPGRSREGRPGSNPVTYQELDKLRQKTQASPEDQAARFLLAKKLVEASIVLVNERADQKTRDKAREDYIFQALKMLKKLSSNQYSEAMFYLGDCYSRGALGLQSDVKEAFTLYQSAAKSNHAQAAYRVAVCCEMGQDEGGGTRKDPVKAMQWYKRAAQLGDVPAMYKMGIIQLKGLLGQPRNASEALVFLKRAAERADSENPHALHELGLLHEKGSDGVPKDERYSRELFIQCANLGYKFSQFRLGCASEYGLMGCPVDPRQSIAWYSKAAVQEEHQSELALSGWYLTGSEGVLQQSDTEAYLWARKAAQAGLAKAEYAMGYFTEVGIGAPANLEDAKRWYWRAASQNFLKARERLEDLRKGGAAQQKTRVSRSHMKKQSDGECIVM